MFAASASRCLRLHPVLPLPPPPPPYALPPPPPRDASASASTSCCLRLRLYLRLPLQGVEEGFFYKPLTFKEVRFAGVGMFRGLWLNANKDCWWCNIFDLY